MNGNDTRVSEKSLEKWHPLGALAPRKGKSEAKYCRTPPGEAKRLPFGFEVFRSKQKGENPGVRLVELQLEQVLIIFLLRSGCFV